jgi:hypothetical protein
MDEGFGQIVLNNLPSNGVKMSRNQYLTWRISMFTFALLLRSFAATEACSPDFCSSPTDCSFRGLHHTALGNAHLAIVNSNLNITNIGSSGLDGVMALLPPLRPPLSAETFMLELDPGNTLPDGSFFLVTSTGVLNGVQNQNVGLLRVEKVAGMVEYTADFSSVGSTTQTIQVYNGERLVTSVSGHTGTAARMPGWLKCFLRGCPPDYWDPTFGSAASITIPGSGSFVGDRVRILAENVSRPPDTVTGTLVQAKNIPSITYTGESVTGVIIVPTLSSWGMITLISALMIGGAILATRKHLSRRLL